MGPKDLGAADVLGPRVGTHTAQAAVVSGSASTRPPPLELHTPPQLCPR